MRLSSDLPPAGFTRAEPRPPARLHRSPRPAIAAALVLSAGLVLALVHGTMQTAPARTVTPGAATPSATRPAPPSATAPSSGRAAPGPDDASSASHPVTRKRPSRHGRAGPSRRTHRPRAPHPGPAARPRVTRHTRTARPAAPSWIGAECRRRFPDDPRRRAACVAVLTGMFGNG